MATLFQSFVLEVVGTNVSTTYITCPADPRKTLGIKLPYLVMIVKNMKKYFTFEVQVLDDKNVRRRFRASNYQSTTRVKPFICTMPMRLDDGWNQIQFNLADFTRRAYGTNYVETLRVQIHANCRIRRVYFSDRLYSEEELPAEFKLYLPVQQNKPTPAGHHGGVGGGVPQSQGIVSSGPGSGGGNGGGGNGISIQSQDQVCRTPLKKKRPSRLTKVSPKTKMLLRTPMRYLNVLHLQYSSSVLFFKL